MAIHHAAKVLDFTITTKTIIYTVMYQCLQVHIQYQLNEDALFSTVKDSAQDTEQSC